MSTRINLSDARWFKDHRAICIIENEFKRQLQAKSENDYKNLLQNSEKNKLVLESIDKVPKILITNSSDNSTSYYCAGGC